MNKNKFVFVIILISGLILGSFIGSTLGNIPYLNWLNYGKVVGLTTPFVLDLSIFTMQFGFTLNFSIAGIIGMVIAIILYKKL